MTVLYFIASWGGSWLIGKWFVDSIGPYMRSRGRSAGSKVLIFFVSIIAAIIISLCWSIKLEELMGVS